MLKSEVSSRDKCPAGAYISHHAASHESSTCASFLSIFFPFLSSPSLAHVLLPPSQHPSLQLPPVEARLGFLSDESCQVQPPLRPHLCHTVTVGVLVLT